MSRSATSSDARRTNAAIGVPLLERLLFYVLVALLCARPLISETFERVELAFLAPVVGSGGPTPATTAWLDSLLLAAAVTVLARRRGPWPGGAPVATATVLLGAALVLSVASAGDKRAALNAGASLLIGVLAGLALIRVMSARWMVHVLIAALLASNCTNAVKCLTQRAYEFEDTLSYWEEQKPGLAARGFNLDDSGIVNFERRLRSAEAYGYLSHPNVAASCLMMGLLVAGGLLGAALFGTRPRPGANALAAGIAGAAICVLLASGLWLTGSSGAILATGGGAALLILFGLARRWIAAHAGHVTALLAGTYLALMAAGVGYGLKSGTLPHSSLAFRWHYWTAAAKTLPEAPLTGIGRENFAPAFMRHKSPESPEEVRNPHNLWLALLVELGPLGLAGGVLLAGACVFGALRRLRQTEEQAEPPGTLSTRRLAPAAVGVLLVQALFSGEQLSNAGVALLWAVILVTTWIVTFMLSAWVIRTGAACHARAEWLVAGLGAAILAALAHNLIGFSLLTPAGLSTFAVCAAAAIALRAGHTPTRAPAGLPAGAAARGRLWPVPALIGIVVVAAHVVVVTVPTTRTQRALDRMRMALSGGQSAAVLEARQRALAADSWDAAAARTVAAGVLQTAMSPELSDARRLELLHLAREYALTARARHERISSVHRLLATTAEALSATYIDLGRPAEALKALHETTKHWDEAVALYPTNPRTRISAGTAWFRLWQQTEAPEAGDKAGAHLLEALTIDDQREPEEVRRLRADERESIHRMLKELQEAGFARFLSSAPASQPD